MRDAAQALNLAPTPIVVSADAADPAPHGDLAADGWAPVASNQIGPAEDTSSRVARLYRELFPAVFGFVRFRVGDGHLAEDITATVFERALSKLATVRDSARVRAWLFTIARNTVIDERRRRRPGAPLEA